MCQAFFQELVLQQTQQIKLLVLMGLMLLWLEKDAINKCTCHLGQAVVSAMEKGEDKEGGGEGCSFN